jgi:hypothetical protein
MDALLHTGPATAAPSRPHTPAGPTRIAAALLVADLRQRTRGPALRVAALAITLGAWWCLPSIDAGYMVVAIGEHHRGYYSSAWIGMVLAMMSLLWSLVSFYLVRGTVQRDFDTRVWQLLGTTSMRRSAYLLAKWASHLVVMGGLLGATLAVGLVAQWLRAEDRHIDLWQLVKPSLFIALPIQSVSAAFAIWFDVIPVLRRTAGNIAFFVVWLASLSTDAVGIAHDAHARQAATAVQEQPWASDLGALRLMQWSIEHQIAHEVPANTVGDGFCIGCGGIDAPPVRFRWTAWEVSPAALWGRMAWLAGALASVLLAVPLLDWAAARAGGAAAANGARAPRNLRWLRVALRPLQSTSLGTLVAAEALVVLRVRPLWWWAAWVPLWGVQSFGPRHGVALAMLGSWTLLIDVFSRTGLRDREHRTVALVGTAPGGPRRLLVARAAMLVGLAWVAVAPGLLHEALAHPAIATSACVIGASLAIWGLAGAALTHGSRPFELLFLSVAYATTQGLPWLDASAGGDTVTGGHLAGIAVAAAILVARTRNANGGG